MRPRAIAIAAAALAVQALGPVSPARAAEPVTVTFSYTGAEQVFDVPASVTSIHVVLVGGRGGLGSSGALGTGGYGARVEGDLTVAEGQTLFVLVGGNGGSGDFNGTPGAGGYNGGGAGGAGFGTWGGGGGGGASDIRTTGSGDGSTLASRLVIAAGGGGAGTNSGGGAGLPGSGAAGEFGEAGTAEAGGAGGVGTASGSAGSLGLGGSGGAGAGPNDRGGGGGGAGLYGGGGAGASDNSSGGGGGSSFTDAATNASVVLDTAGTPSVSITYDVGDAGGDGGSTGTVDATVTMAASAVCLELSTTAIDFGTQQFGEVGAIATPGVGVTNCGGITESILARGTDATGAGPTTWTLVDTGSCAGGTLGLDDYRLTLIDPNTFGETPLTTTNQSLFTLDGGATAIRSAAIDTPCPGSSGAGVVMAMQIVFVATE